MAEKFGKTWWGEQWLQSLSQIDYSNRIPRGLSYARNGAVQNITVTENIVKAKVQGTHKYTVNLAVNKFTPKEVNKFIDKLLQYPAIISNLLNHQLDKEVLDLAKELKLMIFPNTWKDLQMNCSCPDWAVPCKHIAAVIYMISKEIDNDPFLVFKLHGIDILEELKKRDISIDSEAVNVPTFASLLKINESPAFDFDENNAYKSISYSNLRDLTDILPQLLPDNPTFEGTSNFKENYRLITKKIAKAANKKIENIDKLKKETSTSVSKKTKAHFYLTDKGASTACLDETTYKIETFLENILSIDIEEITSYSPSIASTYRLAFVALTLIQHGAVIPQVYVTEKQDIDIRWIPAMLDNAVSEIVKKSEEIVPPTMLQVVPSDKRKKSCQYVENPAFEILSILTTELVHSLYVYNSNPSTENYLLFFGNDFQVNQAEVGKNAIGNSIASWLSRFYLTDNDFRQVVIIEENESETFSVSLAVEDKSQAGEPYIELSKILTLKKYSDIKFKIMQSFSLLGQFIDGVSEYFNTNGKKTIIYNYEKLGKFLFNLLPIVRMTGAKVLLPKSLDNIIRPKATVKIKSSGKGDSKSFFSLSDMLEFDWQIALGDEQISVEEFKKLFNKIGNLMKIKNQYVYLSENDFMQIMKQLEAKEMSQSRLMQIALSEEFNGLHVELSADLKKKIEGINKIEKVEFPDNLNATLRPYQENGYWWMYRNAKLGLGSIIADDMGLGKTLQVITLLLKLKQEGQISEKSPALVVVPTALLFNWEKEIERFAPSLSHFIHHGSQRDIKKANAEIVLTTYGTLRSDAAQLKKLKPQVVVIDEAQNIKNTETAQSKAVKSINAPIKIAMSGTPVENRLSEFWSIMDFANKGLLGTLSKFNENFGKPIQLRNDESVASQFRKVTAPFMMRRLKTDKSIISDLPDKIEQNEYSTLTSEQAALYEKTLDEAMKAIECVEVDDSKSQFKRSALVLQMLMALKQICNHPTQYLKNGKADASLSGKTEMLLQLLDTIVERNEKVLIFTQFYEMGELLRQFITERYGDEPMFYHGGCSVKNREEMIGRFQNNRSDSIFILTIKSAGVGLNLTAASHVIHYDLWWNPAVEAQATDRAYRIGQTKNVQVHRFITKNTFEEKIDAMIQSKKHLADMTVATGENWIGKLSNEELKEVFEIS